MMEKIYADLNEAQKEAVKQIDGSILILAGAGSGKTKTITSRVAYLIKNGLPP
jgi:DNA helicase-2/ATP-dependent DNA helicase PcrA